MKPFNLEEALAGKPVALRDGRKAIIFCRIPDTFTHEDGVKVSFPLLGISLENNGSVDDQFATWRDDGRFASSESGCDIVGMYEEPKLTTEELMEKAFREHLVLKHSLLPEECKGFKVVGKTLACAYILQDLDDSKMYFSYIFNPGTEWSIKD